MIFKENTLATTNPRETPEDHVPGAATPQGGDNRPFRKKQLAEDVSEGAGDDDATQEDDGRR